MTNLYELSRSLVISGLIGPVLDIWSEILPRPADEVPPMPPFSKLDGLSALIGQLSYDNVAY